MYGDDFVFICESVEHFREKFFEWKETFERNWLKLNVKKTKVIVSGSKSEAFKSKVDPCAKCSKRESQI